ncbi:MAG: hypothetical protein V2A79_09135 [Planctomycetota bacterium]
MSNRKPKRSKLFATPAIVGQKVEKSMFLRVGKGQIRKANEAAKTMGCGEPYGADGKFVGSRAEKKRYMQEINRRRADLGEPRFVNFDGGHGDET